MHERNGGEIAEESSDGIDNKETATSVFLNNDPVSPNSMSVDVSESSPCTNVPDAQSVNANANDYKTIYETGKVIQSPEQKIGEGSSGASDVLCDIAEAIFVERFFDASLDEITLDDISDDVTKKRPQQTKGDVGHQKYCSTKETKKFLLRDLLIFLPCFCTCLRRQSIQE
ncbi:hypothetical protein DPMN_188645 [Dreissena polymorpha]|uniref:Uncharacterized protein n=1 Tax=Dreissena polymorpha TaxID=45954 RepID=A0A9D4DRN3_DREPO|nr:hypothetical protein DPMN_188645 [Dreissena polymorpha]